MPAEPSQTPIHYAPPPATSRRLVRRFWLPAFLAVFAASAYWWAPPIWWRVQLSHWYGRATEHVEPADKVAWDVRIENKGYGARSSGSHPYPWRRFYELLSPPGFQSDATVFVGGLRTPGNRPALVTVDVTAQPLGGGIARGPDPQFHIRAFTRGAGWKVPDQFVDRRIRMQLPGYSRLRMFAGSADPADPTHFTIPFDADGRPGVIDGWVRDDRVQLELRPAPLTQPLPASQG